MSNDLKKQLIKLGSTNPELRPHIRPVLASLSVTSTRYPNTTGWPEVQMPLRPLQYSMLKEVQSLLVQTSHKVNQKMLGGRMDSEAIEILQEIDFRLDNAKVVLLKDRDVKRAPPHKFHRDVLKSPYVSAVLKLVHEKLAEIELELENGDERNFHELANADMKLNDVRRALDGWQLK